MKLEVFHHAAVRSAAILGRRPVGIRAPAIPIATRSGGRPTARTGALALSRSRTMPPSGVVDPTPRPDMVSRRLMAAAARSTVTMPGTFGTGTVSPVATGRPRPARVSICTPRVQSDRVSRPRSNPRPNGTRPTSSIGRMVTRYPWLPATNRSSSASSSARDMPMVRSSSWCTCIQTVWYESIRGDANHALSPSSRLARAKVRRSR